MKKLIYSALFLATIGIGFIGCKKEMLSVNNNESNLSNLQLKSKLTSLYFEEDGVLKITSVEAFDSIIILYDEGLHQKLINLNYESYEESINTDNPNTIEDDLLSVILNKDQIVEIGNYLYRINKVNQKIFALHKDYFDNYSDLIKENVQNKNILEFSTEDDVFELLNESKEDEDSEKALSKNCQSSSENNNQGWLQYADFTDVNNIYGKGKDKRYRFNVWLRVRYDNWGIYRKLFTEFKHKESWGGIWDGTYVSIAYQVQYMAKNGNSGNTTKYPSFSFITNPNYTATSEYEYFTKNKEVVHYRATKCLKAYVLRSWVWFRNRATLKPNLFPNNGCLRIDAGGLNSYPC